MKKLSAFLLLCFSAFSVLGQTYFPEKNNWATKKPSELGLDEVKLSQAIEFAKTHESTENPNLKIAHYESAFGREPFGYPVGPMKMRGPATGLIIYKGYVVGQWGDPSRVDLTFSVAKSILSTTAGLAVADGLIADEKDLVYPYMAPIYPYDPVKSMMNKADHLYEEDVFALFGTEHNRKIRWDDLLRQTSDWEGSLWGKPDWADRPSGEAKEWRTKMKKFWTKIARKNNGFEVSVFCHDINTSVAPGTSGYPSANKQIVASRTFSTRQAALVWATEQPAAREH